jgi:hypothetical protein
MSQGRAYQLLRAARVVDECTKVHSLQVVSQVPESERIARELVPLLSNPQALDEAWNEAVEQAHGVPTAREVREVVARKLATTATPDGESPDESADGRQWVWVSFAPEFRLLLAA